MSFGRLRSKRMRLLREELRYWQMMARMDARLCRLSRENVKAVAAQMRAEQRVLLERGKTVAARRRSLAHHVLRQAQ